MGYRRCVHLDPVRRSVVRKLLQTHNTERQLQRLEPRGRHAATGLAGIVPHASSSASTPSASRSRAASSRSRSRFWITCHITYSWLLILLFLLSAITGTAATLEKGTAAAPEDPGCGREMTYFLGAAAAPHPLRLLHLEGETMQNLNEGLLFDPVPVGGDRDRFYYVDAIRIRPAPVL